MVFISKLTLALIKHTACTYLMSVEIPAGHFFVLQEGRPRVLVQHRTEPERRLPNLPRRLPGPRRVKVDYQQVDQGNIYQC